MATSKASPQTKQALSTQNAIIVAILVTVLLVLACGFVAKGQLGQLQLNAKLITAKSKAASDLDTKVANIPILLNNYDNLGDRKQLILSSMPTTPDFPELISQLEKLAGASGVKLKGVSGAPASVSSGIQHYKVSTTFDGTYDRLQQFLKNIEAANRPIHVDSISFAGTTNAMSVKLDMTTYYQPTADVNDKLEPLK